MLPKFFLGLPPWLQYYDIDPPLLHQIKLTLCRYGSTLAGIIRRQFINKYNDIFFSAFVLDDGNFQFLLSKVKSPFRENSPIVGEH